uniref:lysozyme n=1 Tax=Culicoides sonorensis TaxID=179676 RepID=A0A336LK29_CULSO
MTILLLISVFFFMINFISHPENVVEARAFDSKCDFIFELEEFHNVTLEEAAKWACLVTPGASTRDITRTGAETTKTPGQYIGIFKIGSRWWCSPDGGGACKIKCDKLMDDYIGDDLRCARKIGFSGWKDHQFCFQDGWKENIKACEGYVSPLMVAKSQR